MMRILAIFAGMAFCFATVSFASELLPPDMLFQGKPINPECFELLLSPFSYGSREKEVKLKDCQENDEHVTLSGDGEVVYTDPAKWPITSYKYLGEIDGGSIIKFHMITGGSADDLEFDAVERSGDTIFLAKEFGAAGNCTSHVGSPTQLLRVEDEVKNGHLIYGSFVTPEDFFNLAHDNSALQRYYQSLDDHLTPNRGVLESQGSGGCYGEATYEDGKVIAVRLTGGEFGKGNAGGIQSCFDKIYREYVDNGKLSLNVVELKEFTRRFNQQCITH